MENTKFFLLPEHRLVIDLENFFTLVKFIPIQEVKYI